MAAEISVIIPAYNIEGYIERAIRSALDQHGTTVEVIVVNNGSVDGTLAAISRITDERVKLIDLQTNVGAAVARNMAIAEATATWIAILDGDDAFLPDRLARCMMRARMLKADIIVDNLDVHRESDGRHYPMYPPAWFARLGILTLADFIDGNRSFLGGGISLGYLKPVISAEFFRRHKIAYDPTLRIGEDYMVLAECLGYGALCAVEPVAGYQYTVRSGSTSHRITFEDLTRIAEGDAKFTTRFSLNAVAMRAQKNRTAALKDAFAFTKLINALKQRDAKAAFKAVAERPIAVWYLWRPIWARITRLLKGPAQKTTQELLKQKTVLLFYREYESDSFFKHDRYLKRILRPLYRRLRRRQKNSGFAVSFDLMQRGLKKAGYAVHINDYRTARAHPQYPVGLVGFPSLLDDWKLPNPAVLGPSLYDHPLVAPDILKDFRFKKYAVLGPWVMNMFKPVYGDACFSWFAGIDLEEWPDLSAGPKTFDFLIYDKVYWDREEAEKNLIAPILAALDKKGLTYRRIRYKMYDYETYRELLKGARGMLFLSHHETQGIACQEALASNVPILAWDKGVWTDPLWHKFSPIQPRASSVPFFSPDCGEKFRDISEFENALDRFMNNRSRYTPRAYVEQNLSMDISARLYAEAYFGLISEQALHKNH